MLLPVFVFLMSYKVVPMLNNLRCCNHLTPFTEQEGYNLSWSNELANERVEKKKHLTTEEDRVGKGEERRVGEGKEPSFFHKQFNITHSHTLGNTSFN